MRIKIKTDGTAEGTIITNADTGDDLTFNVTHLKYEQAALDIGQVELTMRFINGIRGGKYGFVFEGNLDALLSGKPKEAE